jgi:hypothetical protein
MNRFVEGQLLLLLLDKELYLCYILDNIGNDSYRVNIKSDYLCPTSSRYTGFQTISGSTLQELAINIEDLST